MSLFQGAIQVELFNRKCLSQNCQTTFLQEAEHQCIFFFSKHTCAGDEVGWDFVNAVLKGRVSFTGFCKEKSRQYVTNNLESRSFMSPNTFISWFFGWIAALRIDFRKEVDPFCKYNPKMLVGDGTHIGLSVRNQKMDYTVCEADDPSDPVVPKHKK